MQTTSTNSGTKYIYTVTSVTGGKNYKASAYVIKQGEVNANILLKVAFYQNPDGTGSQIDGISYTSPKITQNSTEFQYLDTDTISAPATATSARIRPSIEMPTGAVQNGIAYFDDIQFEEIITSTPTPIPSPTFSLSPTPTPSPTPKLSSFTISNIPSQINSDQSFNVPINLSLPDNGNTNFYLKGAFKKSDSSNYFGQTKVSGSWVKNGSSYSNQFPITTDSSGSWSGNLEIKPDNEDSGFIGTDDYIFKIGRYTSSGSGPTWSNESTIKITSQENSQGETSANTFVPTTTSLQVKTFTPNPTKNYDRLSYRIASVAAATTSATLSASTSTGISVKGQRQTSLLIWTGLIFIFAGAGSIGYIYLKSNGKIPF